MTNTVFSNTPVPPVTETALLAEHQRFWHGFNRFTIGGIIAVVCVLVLVLFAIL